jgi:hypothetical protein
MINVYDCPIFYSIRFGSIIAGLLQSKTSAKGEKSGETKGTLEKKKRQRGSFSFHGGMQVLIPLKNLCIFACCT